MMLQNCAAVPKHYRHQPPDQNGQSQIRSHHDSEVSSFARSNRLAPTAGSLNGAEIKLIILIKVAYIQ